MPTYKFIATEFDQLLHEGEFESADEVEEVLLFLTEYFGCPVECVQVQNQTVSKKDKPKAVKRVSKRDESESFVGFLSWMLVIVLLFGSGVSWIAVSVYRPSERAIPNQRPNLTDPADLLIPQRSR
jgi:hypothetical protein